MLREALSGSAEEMAHRVVGRARGQDVVVVGVEGHAVDLCAVHLAEGGGICTHAAGVSSAVPESQLNCTRRPGHLETSFEVTKRPSHGYRGLDNRDLPL